MITAIKRFFFVVFLCYTAALFAAAPSAQQLVPAGHWVYDAVTALALEAGETTFAQSAPLSIGELRRYLNDINYDNLSRAGRQTFDRVIEYFNAVYPSFGAKFISLGTDLTLAPEVRYKTNPQITWITDFTHRQKLLELPLIFAVGDYAVIKMDITLGQNYWTSIRAGNYSNIPLEADDIDLNFPQTSYLSAGARTKEGEAFMNFQLGAGQLQAGRTQTGSIILSDALYGPSYAQLSFFSPNLRYAITPIQLNVDKYLYMHRLEARLFKRFTISLMEGVLISKPFELRFLNPAAIFHNMNSWLNYRDENGNPSADSNSAAYFGVLIDINPWKYLRFYGQFVMNQFQTKHELSGSSSAAIIPNGLGGQGGVETWVPWLSGYWNGGIEAVYTMPYMYISKKPQWSFFRSSRFMPKSGTDVNSWVGTPFGPDTIAGQIKVGYTVFDRWSAFLSYRLKAQGENTFNTPFPTTSEQAQAKTPTGIPEYEHAVVLRGSWKILDWLTLNGHAAYVYYINHAHIRGNTQQGAEFSLSACMRLSPLLSNGVK